MVLAPMMMQPEKKKNFNEYKSCKDEPQVDCRLLNARR